MGTSYAVISTVRRQPGSMASAGHFEKGVFDDAVANPELKDRLGQLILRLNLLYRPGFRMQLVGVHTETGAN